MPEGLSGVIERVTYHNPDTGYCVLRVHARGNRDLITVVGTCPQVVAGEYVEAGGDWVTDRDHGLQFKASQLRTTPPHTESGIVKYLSSGLVKGIGAKYAKKIVEVFGDKTLEVIDASPAHLSGVKGIGPKRIELIRRGWQEQKHVRAILVFLQSHGFGTARAVRIYKEYGETAVEQVRANPYRLSTDIWGVGFRTADELAMRLNVPRDSPLRVQAAVRHTLAEAGQQGSCCLPEQLLVERTAGLVGLADEAVAEAVESLRTGGEIIRDEPRLAAGQRVTVSDTGLDDGASLIYLKPMFFAESGVARSIRKLLGGPHPLQLKDVAGAVAYAENGMGIEFAKAQRQAVGAAATEKVLVLTGGPGTGKTTIVKAILAIYQAKRLRVLLAAPTGRAAKRLSEASGLEARTVHRALEYDPSQRGFRKNADEPFDADLVVLDEASMADVSLMNSLLKAVPPWAALLIVGDRDQLPSVGPGMVLGDLIDSGCVPVVRLTQVHRQASASYIIRAAHALNEGHEPESAPPGGDGDFYFLEVDDPELCVARILEMASVRIPKRFGLDPIRDIQVLAPVNKGTLGVHHLNQRLQEVLNPAKPGQASVTRFGNTFRVGDKVIQTQNNYQREVYNGDIGQVIKLDAVDQVLTVLNEGREVEYEFSDLDELSLAYCCTIHKSQGSEYPAVIIPVHTQHWVMLQRNLIYTGITRGKQLVAVVGSRKALSVAARKAGAAERFTLLKWRLQAGGVAEGERGVDAPRSPGSLA